MTIDRLPFPATREWNELAQSVASGNCIVMFGPDAVTCRVEGTQNALPVLDALGDHLRDQLKKVGVPIDKALVRPSIVAETVVASRGRDTLERWVEDFYATCQLDTTALDDLARLPVDLIVNTVPGFRLEDVFVGDKADRKVEHYSQYGDAAPLVADGTIDAPLIYHLYGSLDDTASLIISDTDLLNLLVSVIGGQPKLPENLVSTIRDPERTFLFLGFQLYEWQLRVLVHVLDEACERSTRSPALERIPNPELDTETVIYYAGPRHQIDFFGIDAPSFLAELAHRVAGGDNREESDVPVDLGGPPVFLCHTDADKSQAEELARRLRARGITTWLDKENLRGASEWNLAIENVLTREARFVVVLQSQNLLDQVKRISYVNKEINIALELQQKVGFGGTFLIPTFIEEIAPLKARIDEGQNQLQLLQSLHWIDLTESIDRLVDVIEREIERDRKTRRHPWP